MHTRRTLLVFLLGTLLAAHAFATSRFVNVNNATPSPPYTSWGTAARVIQDAIDAASPGDTVVVTNGVYRTGGKVMAGDLSNRVVLDKALILQSVNGPLVTIIEGAGTMVGAGAVRCAWVTNGALLTGFTLRAGVTRNTTDSTLGSGAGVWCVSATAQVSNCLILSNAAYYSGGGVYQGTLNTCALVGNWCTGKGGGAAHATLLNCTVTDNSGPGADFCTLTNCIVYFNNPFGDYDDSTLAYCCAAPLAPGPGNINIDPQLLADGIHLAATSPCLRMGFGKLGGLDIDGQPWDRRPPIGCDQWQPDPVVGAPPLLRFTSNPIGFTLGLTVAGQLPVACWWTRDGVAVENNGGYSGAHTLTLTAQGTDPLLAGAYQAVVSNAFGMITSPVARVVVHCVNAAGSGPVPPFARWDTAATNLQDAVEAAAAGEVIWVTNGLYAAGGKVMAGDLTNRIAVDKPLLIQSVNGPVATVIQGAGAVNGPTAVRCAWLTNGAVLNGFTLRGGATRSNLFLESQQGGGVWCASSNALVANCLIQSNSAFYIGGGACYGTLNNCWLAGNTANSGGGAAYSSLLSCTVVNNSGYGAIGGKLTNCIVYYNSPANFYYLNFPGSLAYCCTTPSAAGIGNISSMPQLLADALHLAGSSPCRAAGTNLVSGSDIDGQPWANPPAIGCDEVWGPTLSAGSPRAGRFSFNFSALPGATYTVEKASSLSALSTWSTVTNFMSTGGWVEVTDTNATDTMRFYRVRTQ